MEKIRAVVRLLISRKTRFLALLRRFQAKVGSIYPRGVIWVLKRARNEIWARI